MKVKIENSRQLFFWGGLCGLIAFLFYAPIGIVDPSNISWLFSSGDAAVHFASQLYFINSPWEFPLISSNPNYGLEESSSVAYSDSIPLASLLLKLLVSIGIVNGNFQIYGIFIVLSYLLFSTSTLWILKRYVTRSYSAILLTLLITLTPLVAWRLMPNIGHIGLTSQWSLIVALGLFVFRIPSNIAKRALFLAIVFSINATYGIQAFCLWTGYWIGSLVESTFRRRFKNTIRILLIEAITMATMSAVSIYMSGYLGFNTSSEGWGYGFFGYNLADVIDPTGWDVDKTSTESVGFSTILDSIRYDQNYEGFYFIGLGAIVLVIAGWIIFTKRLMVGNNTLAKRFTGARIRMPVLACIGIMLGIAVTHEIRVGPYTYFLASKFYIPRDLIEFMGIFRASSRYALPAIYASLLYCAILLAQFLDQREKWIGKGLLCLLLTIQIMDLSGGAHGLRSSLSDRLNAKQIAVEIPHEIRDRNLRSIGLDKPLELLDVTKSASLLGIPIDFPVLARYRNRSVIGDRSRVDAKRFQEVNMDVNRSSTAYVFSMKHLSRVIGYADLGNTKGSLCIKKGKRFGFIWKCSE